MWFELVVGRYTEHRTDIVIFSHSLPIDTVFGICITLNIENRQLNTNIESEFGIPHISTHVLLTYVFY